MSERIQGGVHEPRRHDSAVRHVSGEAAYVDDLPEPAGLLHVQLGLSAKAHARIKSIDLAAVRAAPGVVCVLTAADVPGVNDVSPTHRHDEPLFATGLVEYVGQPMTLMQVDYFKSSEQYAGSGLGTYVVVRVLFDNGDEEMFSTGAPNLVASFRQFERLGRIGGDNPIRLKITSKTTSAGELLRVARP